MNNYKIFLCNESGKLIEAEQIKANTMQDAIVQIDNNYDTIEKIWDEK